MFFPHPSTPGPARATWAIFRKQVTEILLELAYVMSRIRVSLQQTCDWQFWCTSGSVVVS